ncbi:hypothetical protein F5884DRAFT_259961 [Xylogone sp. PMI_703]|nr:hypothetical protein F5884DRAFT_259961 [Xylogone sp. PMI_703]
MAYMDEGVFRSLDEETAYLVLQVQLQDLDASVSSDKGNGREGQTSDNLLTLRAQIHELQNFCSLHTDRRMARSIATAIYNDEELLAQAESQEEIAREDHSLALRLSEGTIEPNTNASQEKAANDDIEDELIDKLRALYVFGPDNQPTRYAGLSQLGFKASSQVEYQQRVNHECEACREQFQFYEIARAPYSHEYCRTCIQDLFKASITDESLFPPRCCRQQIPIAAVGIFLKPNFIQDYQKKKIEFETPNRTYCHSSTCSTFINSIYIQDEVATCPDCRLSTCTNCKAEAHGGDCPNDTSLQEVLLIARENGWQRCYSCKRVIELEHGCNHMTCRCGAQFCYICGLEWKTCTCPQ